MSVALLIEKIDGTVTRDYLPISGELSFKTEWLPVCRLLHLKWIPLFQTGGTFDENDIPFILEELVLLRDHFASLEKEKIKTRLSYLIKKLESLKGKSTVFFIG